MTTRILAGDMWVVYNFGDPNTRYQNFLSIGKPRFERFLDSLLLYDEVIVPTDDFLSVAVLVGVMGVEPILALAESGSLQIVRTKGFLAYVGNGGGLLGSNIARCSKGGIPISSHMDEAIFEIMSGMNNVDQKAAQRLTDAFIPLTRERALSVDDKIIRAEIYHDILESDTLRAAFSGTDLARLPGISPKEVRTYDALSETTDDEDQISLILRLAQATLEIHLATYADCRDVSTSNPIGQLLKAKQQAAGSLHSGIFTLKELADIPSTVDWVLEDSQRLKKLLKLRESSAGRAFRNWIHDVVDDKDGDVAKAYVSLLRSEPATTSLPARIMRFLVTSGWAACEPISGTALSVVDGFIADKFLASRSPKFFIDRLARLSK
ncbi:hypothetical protein [Paenirhodobacter populi]|uniref:hypothetical protein n=1 Tax=Paenirhodobacter populi TaxID=2306993 RepID=UPI000FE37967|nr:hypothetical protein [Sinirhodobacter populi]RWR04188.1 hypothetical protein D2T32_20390 [Sinirhodobacter populi]